MSGPMEGLDFDPQAADLPGWGDTREPPGVELEQVISLGLVVVLLALAAWFAWKAYCRRR